MSSGEAGYEGMQEDNDGNIWLVEDIGAPGSATFSGAKQPNSFVYRLVPYQPGNLGAGGKLQVLQIDDKGGQPVTFGAPATSLADVNTTFMKDLHTYGNAFTTRWVTIHDTAVDGIRRLQRKRSREVKRWQPPEASGERQFPPGHQVHRVLLHRDR